MKKGKYKYMDYEFTYSLWSKEGRSGGLVYILDLHYGEKKLNTFFKMSEKDVISDMKNWIIEKIKPNNKPTKAESANNVFLEDEYGNSISITQNGAVILNLASEDRVRTIGVLNKAEGTFEFRREEKKHLHRKSKSYGFNYWFLAKTNSFSHILFTIKGDGTYKIPKEEIIDNGKFLFFKQQGFELQTFLKVDKIKEFRVS